MNGNSQRTPMRNVYGAVLGYVNGSMPASIKNHELVVSAPGVQKVERYARRGNPPVNAVLAVGLLGQLEELAENTNADIFHPKELESDGSASGRGYFETLATEQLDRERVVRGYWENQDS